MEIKYHYKRDSIIAQETISTTLEINGENQDQISGFINPEITFTGKCIITKQLAEQPICRNNIKFLGNCSFQFKIRKNINNQAGQITEEVKDYKIITNYDQKPLKFGLEIDNIKSKDKVTIDKYGYFTIEHQDKNQKDLDCLSCSKQTIPENIGIKTREKLAHLTKVNLYKDSLIHGLFRTYQEDQAILRHGYSQSINQNSLNSFYQSGSFVDNKLKSGEKKIFFNNGDSATLQATTFIDTLPEINEIQNKDKIIENDAIIFGCNQQRKCFYQTSASNNHKYFTLTDDPRLNLDKLGYFVRANPNAQIVFDKTFLAHFATNKAEEQELITIIEGCKIFIARSCNYEDESMANFIWQNQELFFKHTEVATHSANSIFNEVYSKSGQPSLNFFKAGINQIAEVENWHITAKSHNSAKTIREEESPIKTRKKEYLWGLWQSEQEEYFLDIERIQKFANTKPTRQQKIDYFYDIINNANYPINVEDLVTSLNCFQEESAEDESYKTSMLDNFLDKTNFKHNDILYIIDNLQAKALTFKSFIDYLPALKNANSIFSAIFLSLKDRILEEEGLIIAKKFTEEGDLCFYFLKQKDINQEISRSENDQILLISSEKINNNKSLRFTALNKFPEAKISKVYNSKTKNQILNTKQNNINKFVFSQHGTRLGGNDLDLDTKFWQKFFKNNKDTKNLKISDISCFGSCLHKIIDDSQEIFNFLDRKQELSFQIIASNINNSIIAKKLQNYQNFSIKKNNSLLEIEKREKLKIVVARDNKGELTINIYNLRQLNEEEIEEIKDSQNSTKLDYKKIASTAKTCQKIIDNDKFEDIFEEDLSENDFDLGEIDYDLIEEASTNDNESFVAMPFISFNPSIASKVSFKQLQL